MAGFELVTEDFNISIGVRLRRLIAWKHDHRAYCIDNFDIDQVNLDKNNACHGWLLGRWQKGGRVSAVRNLVYILYGQDFH